MGSVITIPTPAVCGRGGWTRAAWVGQQQGRKATLYLIRLTGNGETFYKVGITFCFSSRFSRLNMPYTVRTLARYSSYSAGRVYDLEAKILRKFAHLGYTPLLPFAGASECFSEFESVLAALPQGVFVLRHVRKEE